jgi:hypothetical protein
MMVPARGGIALVAFEKLGLDQSAIQPVCIGSVQGAPSGYGPPRLDEEH